MARYMRSREQAKDIYIKNALRMNLIVNIMRVNDEERSKGASENTQTPEK